MSGTVRFEQKARVGRVTISHPQRFNAMSRGMWQQLCSIFKGIHANPGLRCVVIAGENQNFCAGGDISEYAQFRFQEASLREFHEIEVWGGLQAMLDCDVPIVAQIEGNCMGAGLEIASCCDIRLASTSARFGAPIGRLGFPMAPREAALVAREVGPGIVRQMLLEATIFPASDMLDAGFLSRVLSLDQLAVEAQATGLRIDTLAPQATRLNKQTLRALVDSSCPKTGGSYHYADSAEHREGIVAFLEKRAPEF